MKYLIFSLIAVAISCGSYYDFDNHSQQDPASEVDYPGFVSMTSEVQSYRQSRLLDASAFAKKAQEKNVIILDTRSKDAFDKIHIKGAIHLNFSDFTEPRLAQVIPDKNTCILIYCNNNVNTEMPALYSKSTPLALNIPTFINLYGYGYKNIYELSSLIELHNAHIEFVGTQAGVANKDNFTDLSATWKASPHLVVK